MSLFLLVVSCAGAGGVVLAVLVMAVNSWRATLRAFELRWPDGLSTREVRQWLANIAASTHSSSWSLLPMPPVVIELVADAHGVRFYVLAPAANRDKVLADLRAAVPGARVQPAPDYLTEKSAWSVAAEMHVTSRVSPLSELFPVTSGRAE